MRKFLFLIIYLLGIVSCTSDEYYVNNERSPSMTETTLRYEAKRKQIQERLGQICELLEGTCSRSDTDRSKTGVQYINCLTSLSTNRVDSLFTLYCTPKTDQIYDKCLDAALDTLISLTSEKEVNQLFDFIDAYIDNGGHNSVMLYNAIQGTTSIIGDYMVDCAAGIDEFMINHSQIEVSHIYSYCLERMLLDLINSAVENKVINVIRDLVDSLIVIPGVDVAADLILAGVDLYTAIRIAHDFQMCCIRYIS